MGGADGKIYDQLSDGSHGKIKSNPDSRRMNEAHGMRLNFRKCINALSCPYSSLCAEGKLRASITNVAQTIPGCSFNIASYRIADNDDWPQVCDP
jgi:hypothetical protein